MDRIRDAIGWFKTTFRDDIARVPASAALGIDFFAAIATQESSEVWGGLIRGSLRRDEILALSVGDTIEAPGRKAFPRDKAALLTLPEGAALFEVARRALVEVGAVNAAYRRVAAARPDAFCHGFGIFQYDIQFARTDPGFFLKREWHAFDRCLDRFMIEMGRARRAAHVADKAVLSHDDRVFVGIAYNTGRVDPARGFKQGHRDRDSGLYYGEMIDRYLKIAESVG